MRELTLSNSDLKALVDDEDYERCLQFNWHLSKNGTVRTTLQLSNFIMHNQDMIDHKDRNSLNNQKTNYRLCSRSQNGANRDKWKKNASSKYKGVTWNKKSQSWVAQIKHNSTQTYLGSYSSEEKAAKAYNIKARELFGEFAVLNKIEEVIIP